MSLVRIFKQSSIYLLGDMARRTVGFFMIPVYTRYLNPADYGMIELVELFVAVATITFGILATSDAMVRIYHDYTNQEEDAGKVVSTTLWYMGLAGLAIAAIAWFCAGFLSELLFRTREYAYLIRYAFTAMFFANLIEVGLVYERMRQRATYFVVFSLVQLTATLALNIYFIVFAGLGVWGFVLSKLIVSGLGAGFIVLRVGRQVGWKTDWRAGKAMFRFGAPLVLSSAALFGIHFGNRFFLNHYTTLSDVGIYALAYKFGLLVTYLVGEPFGRTWGVNLYEYVAQANWREYFARVVTYLVFFLLLVAAILSIFINETLVLISTPAFYECAKLVSIVAFAYAFRELGDFFRGVLFIRKRSHLYSGITVSCAVASCGLNFLLIPAYGAMGAAWATALTWLGYLIFCWIMAWREYKIPYRVRSFVAILATAGIVCWASSVIRPMGLWEWVTDAIWVGVFVAFVWTIGYFTVDERSRIRRYLILQKGSFGFLSPRAQ